MNRDELLEQLNFYRKLVEELGDIIESLRNSIDEMHKDHKESQSYIKTLLKQITDLTEKLDKALATIGNLEQKLSDYDSRNDLNNQHRFGSRSQKGISPRKSSGGVDRTEQKDSFSVPECTPLHRELTRMLAHNMSLSEKTLTNWLDKVSKFLYKMLPALKAKALEAGTAVNCDETWCRVRISDKYTKKYIWCLVNRQTKSVLFFYDNGSRGRQVLTDFLGSAEIVALQSDGYNAYTFLDNELTDIEHMMTVERKRSSFAGLLPTGRKNSLMFGSHKGAEMSAIFHTFIETCKINGISTIEYFKKLLSELLTGNNKTRTLFAHSVGFENVSLLPQTIGIKR